MSEHPLDRELRILIDLTHARLTALVDIANVLSDARRLEDDLDFDARVISSVTRVQQNGGSLHQQASSVSGNAAYGNGTSGLGYHPPGSGGVPSPSSQAPYTLKQALANASVVEQTPYPDETTYNPGVPPQYVKTYGY